MQSSFTIIEQHFTQLLNNTIKKSHNEPWNLHFKHIFKSKIKTLSEKYLDLAKIICLTVLLKSFSKLFNYRNIMLSFDI